jgi:hypothetical protein
MALNSENINSVIIKRFLHYKRIQNHVSLEDCSNYLLKNNIYLSAKKLKILEENNLSIPIYIPANLANCLNVVSEFTRLINYLMSLVHEKNEVQMRRRLNFILNFFDRHLPPKY